MGYSFWMGVTALGFFGLWISYCWAKAERINRLMRVRITEIRLR